MVAFNEHQASEYLKPFIATYWTGNFNKQSSELLRRLVLPNGYVELIIHLSDLHCDLYRDDQMSQSPAYTLIGVYSTPYLVEFKGEVNVFCIRFKPEGFYSLFGIPAAMFSSGFEDFELLLGKEMLAFCKRIREAKQVEEQLQVAEYFLLKQLQKRKNPITFLNHAAELIRKTRGFIMVEEVAQRSFISNRQLERAFNSKIGISPKQYIGLSRFNEVHRLLQHNQALPFTSLAYDCGYADQAHFIRDFRKFSGENPRIFRKNKQAYFTIYNYQ